MKLLNKTSYLALAATAAIAFTLTTTSAQAQETATADANVTVSNAFTLAQVADLEFGTIVATRRGGGGGGVATIVVDPDAATTTAVTNAGGATDDFIIEIAGGDRAEFDISGALATTTMNITLPAGPVLLSCGACSGAEPDFSVGAFTEDGGDGTVATDGAGDATFFVGATLSTIAGANAYEDGLYTNTFDVTVGY